MPWAQFPQLLADLPTTDPTSRQLALLGVVTYLVFEVLARPSHRRSNRLERDSRKRKPSAPLTQRRVA